MYLIVVQNVPGKYPPPQLPAGLHPLKLVKPLFCSAVCFHCSHIRAPVVDRASHCVDHEFIMFYLRRKTNSKR